MKVQSNRTEYVKIEKSKLAVFWSFLGLILAMFLTSRSYDFDAIARAGALLGVERLQNFMNNHMKFEKF